MVYITFVVAKPVFEQSLIKVNYLPPSNGMDSAFLNTLYAVEAKPMTGSKLVRR